MHRQAKQFQDCVPAAWVSDIEKHFEAVRSQFEYKDPKDKTKFARHWYEPEAHSIYDLFKEVGLEKQYEEGYKPLSGVEHSDAMAFFAMIAGAEKKGDERKLEIQSDLFVPHYLRNAFQYFADIFGICNKTIHLADYKEFEETVSSGINFYKSDMLARGIPP